MNHYEQIKTLIGKEVSTTGTCGTKKGHTVEGLLSYEDFMGYIVTHKNIPCLVNPLSITLK